MRQPGASWSVLSAVLAVGVAGACGDNETGKGGDLFADKPECAGDPIVAFAGTQPMVINTLAIGTKTDGFDLDGDRDPDCTADAVAMGMCNEPDNKLSAIASVAQDPLDDALAGYSLLIPLELFDYDAGGGDDDCVKFALYLGSYPTDADGDGAATTVQGGDCDDADASVRPGTAEIAGNFKDDNCDGRADELSETTPSADILDRDADGQSPSTGDCDDTDATVSAAAAEVCGDGKDNDCDGTADRTGTATDTACNPFTAPQSIPIDPLSLDAAGKPQIVFDDGTITTEGADRILRAGPSLFALTIPLIDDIGVELRISGATIEAKVREADGKAFLEGGRLGGVLDARTIDTIRGIDAAMFGIYPENSLLDAAYAGILGTFLSLPLASADVQAKYPDCRTPDIDVDGDGFEAFCETDPNATRRVIDICIDGDGTEIADIVDGNGNVTMECSAAQVDGKNRFADGISVELNFSTAPATALVRPVAP